MPDLVTRTQHKDRFDLKALYDTSRLLSSSLDRDFVLDSLLFTAMSKLLVPRGAIFLFDPLENGYRVAAAKGLPDLQRNDLLRFDITPSGDGEITLPDSLKQLRLALVLPITFGSRDLGIVALGPKATGGVFETAELDFIRSLINISSPAVHNSIMVEELKQANRDLDAKIQQLNTLFDLSQEFNATMDRDRLVRLLSLALMGQLLVRQHVFMLKPIDTEDENGRPAYEQFEIVAAQGIEARNITETLRERLCGQDEILLLEDPLPENQQHWADLRSIGIVLVLPLRQQGQLCGVLCLGPKMTGQPYLPDDVEFLQSLGNLALVSIRNSYLLEDQVEKRRLEEEMRLARRIQMRLLPQDVPQIPAVEIAAAAQPSRLVGGDYFDVKVLGDNRSLAAIADVTGKGMPASLLMANLQACLHVLFPMDMTLEEATGRINRVICENTDFDKFITYFHGIVEGDERVFRYVNAGHNPPYLVRAGGDVHMLEEGGLLLGVMASSTYEMGRINLEPEDVIVMFTDGVTEAMNRAQEEFGEDRLVECIVSNRHRPAHEILKAIRADVDAFTGPRAVLDDDITLVVIKAR